jgi:hypothetical protein
MRDGLLLAHALNSARFRFAGVISFRGVEVVLGGGLNVGDGVRVAFDAHLHHAGMLGVPHLWLL